MISLISPKLILRNYYIFLILIQSIFYVNDQLILINFILKSLDKFKYLKFYKNSQSKIKLTFSIFESFQINLITHIYFHLNSELCKR
jgi:hypothetical protein